MARAPRQPSRRTAATPFTALTTGASNAGKLIVAEQQKFFERQAENLERLNPDIDADFVIAINVLVKTALQHEKTRTFVAAGMRVAPNTITRWSEGENLPDRELTREGYFRRMKHVMPTLMK